MAIHYAAVSTTTMLQTSSAIVIEQVYIDFYYSYILIYAIFYWLITAPQIVTALR